MPKQQTNSTTPITRRLQHTPGTKPPASPRSAMSCDSRECRLLKREVRQPQGSSLTAEQVRMASSSHVVSRRTISKEEKYLMPDGWWTSWASWWAKALVYTCHDRLDIGERGILKIYHILRILRRWLRFSHHIISHTFTDDLQYSLRQAIEANRCRVWNVEVSQSNRPRQSKGSFNICILELYDGSDLD